MLCYYIIRFLTHISLIFLHEKIGCHLFGDKITRNFQKGKWQLHFFDKDTSNMHIRKTRLHLERTLHFPYPNAFKKEGKYSKNEKLPQRITASHKKVSIRCKKGRWRKRGHKKKKNWEGHTPQRDECKRGSRGRHHYLEKRQRSGTIRVRA